MVNYLAEWIADKSYDSCDHGLNLIYVEQDAEKMNAMDLFGNLITWRPCIYWGMVAQAQVALCHSKSNGNQCRCSVPSPVGRVGDLTGAH